MQPPPLPPKGQFIQSIRESCRDVRVAAGIQVNPEAIKRLLFSSAFSDTFAALRVSHGVTIPLNFPNATAELNFLGILALVNCASGYRVPLHAATGRGAYDNIQALVFSLYLTSSDGNGPSNLMSAKGMQTMRRESIAGMMSISLHVEKPHPTIPGLVVGELGGPLLELAEMIAQTLRETGDILEKAGYPDMGAFLAEALNDANKEGQKTGIAPTAEVVLERVVTAFPAFQDMAIVLDRPVYIFKKALFLIHAIVLRFGPIGAQVPLIPVPDSSILPVFADNVLPSMLIHLGALDLSSATSKALRGLFTSSQEEFDSRLAAASLSKGGGERDRNHPLVEGPHLSRDDAFILRAATVDQCERIVQAARDMDVPEDKLWLRTMTTPELDGWIWAVAKDRPTYRNLPRFVERPTLFY